MRHRHRLELARSVWHSAGRWKARRKLEKLLELGWPPMLRRPMRSLVATIHYFERINPQSSPAAGVVFDDISWSEDMREMWREMSGRSDFADAADRATFGICVRSAGRADPPRYWDLQEVPGRTRIGEPHGWRNE